MTRAVDLRDTAKAERLEHRTYRWWRIPQRAAFEQAAEFLSRDQLAGVRARFVDRRRQQAEWAGKRLQAQRRRDLRRRKCVDGLGDHERAMTHRRRIGATQRQAVLAT